MATTIKTKHSTTAGNAPSSLETGELAINVADGNLFYGDGSGVSQDFAVNTITAQKYIVSSSVTYMTQSFSSGSTAFGDSADDSHEFTGNITASGDISASGTIVGSNLSGTNTGDQDISKFVENAHTAMPLFTFVTSTDSSDTPAAGEFLQIDSIVDSVSFNSQSLDGVDLAPDGITKLIYNSPGTILTVIETGSGAYKSYRTNTVQTQTGDHIKFGLVALTQDSHGSGSISNGDIVYLRVDQSTATVEFQSAGANDHLFAPLLDSTFNFLDVRYTDDNIGLTGLNTTFDTTNTDIRILPAISKSADITIAGLTVNGDITVTGTVDGTDVAQLKTDFDTLEGKTLISSSAQFTTSDNITLGTLEAEVKLLELNSASIDTSTDGSAVGDVIYMGGTTTTAGFTYYLNSAGGWNAVDANVEASSSGMLAMALGTDSDTNGMLLKGLINPGGVGMIASNIGDPVYLHTIPGKLTGDVSSYSTNDVVRVVGYQVAGDCIYFNPDSTYIVHA